MTKFVLLQVCAALILPGLVAIVKSTATVLGVFPSNSIRLFFAVIFCLLLLNRRFNLRKIFLAPRRDLALIFFAGIVTWAIQLAIFTYGATKSTLPNIMAIGAVQPLVVYLYSLFLLKEKPNGKILSLAALSFYGVLVIATGSIIPKLSAFGKGEFWVIVSVLLGSLSPIVRKSLSLHLSNVEIALIHTFVAQLTITLIGSLFVPDFVPKLISPEINTLLPLLIAGGLLVAVRGNILILVLRHLDPTTTTQIDLIAIPVSALIGALFFHESLPESTILGAVIIICAIFLTSKVRQSLALKKLEVEAIEEKL